MVVSASILILLYIDDPQLYDMVGCPIYLLARDLKCPVALFSAISLSHLNIMSHQRETSSSGSNENVRNGHLTTKSGLNERFLQKTFHRYVPLIDFVFHFSHTFFQFRKFIACLCNAGMLNDENQSNYYFHLLRMDKYLNLYYLENICNYLFQYFRVNRCVLHFVIRLWIFGYVSPK